MRSGTIVGGGSDRLKYGATYYSADTLTSRHGDNFRINLGFGNMKILKGQEVNRKVHSLNFLFFRSLIHSFRYY